MNLLLRPNAYETTHANLWGHSARRRDIAKLTTGSRTALALSIHSPLGAKQTPLWWHGQRHHALVLGLWGGQNLHVYSDFLPVWRSRR